MMGAAVDATASHSSYIWNLQSPHDPVGFHQLLMFPPTSQGHVGGCINPLMYVRAKIRKRGVEGN